MTHLPRRTRIFLALLGLLFLIAALLTLAYAFAPGSQSRQQFPLPPDAFVTPEARHSDWEIGSISKIEPILNISESTERSHEFHELARIFLWYLCASASLRDLFSVES